MPQPAARIRRGRRPPEGEFVSCRRASSGTGSTTLETRVGARREVPAGGGIHRSTRSDRGRGGVEPLGRSAANRIPASEAGSGDRFRPTRYLARIPAPGRRCPPPVNRQDVQLIEHTTLFDGYFRIDRYRLRHRLHRGGMSRELSREVFERGHVAGVLPVDPDRDRVVLIEQFRIGPYAAGWEPWLFEGVAGIIDEGESPEEVCRREAMEEAGCTVSALIPIARYLSSPGALSEVVDLYCGRTDSRALGGVHGLEAEGEDIKVHVMPVDEALAMLKDGRIVNGKSIIALQWLALNYERVKRAWRGPAPG